MGVIGSICAALRGAERRTFLAAVYPHLDAFVAERRAASDRRPLETPEVIGALLAVVIHKEVAGALASAVNDNATHSGGLHEF